MKLDFKDIYHKSIDKPEDFWKEISNDIFWFKKPTKILNNSKPPFYKWFEDGITNSCYNALDFHIDGGRGDKTALIYDSPITGNKGNFSFKQLKNKVIAGFNISCIGDNRAYSYLPSRKGNTLSDKIAKHVLRFTDPNFISYQWEDRGSDERQYCAPKIDLPIASIMRTKYGEYPEYHTSMDNLKEVVTPEGLNGGYYIVKKCLEAIENNYIPEVTVLGEPQLGKRGLYPSLSTKETHNQVKTMMNLISWSDGNHSLLEISERINEPIWSLYQILENLKKHKVIKLK